MSRHTSMPSRLQKTPHGDVTLTSRWTQSRYYLVAYGSIPALRWLFPDLTRFEVIGDKARHTFLPGPRPVTVERELRKICLLWQARWDEELDSWTHLGSTATSDGKVLVTVSDLFDHLFELRKGSLAGTTVERDRSYLKHWRLEFGADTPLGAITSARIDAALRNIAARTSPGTANSALGTLNAFLNWAVNQAVIPHAGHKSVRRLKEPSRGRTRDWWQAKEVEVALTFAARDSHQPTATLLVACGCLLGLRLEEIIMLRWQDLDLDAHDPKTGEARPVCHVTPHSGWKPKDGEPRSIPISNTLVHLLQQHRVQTGYVLVPDDSRKNSPSTRERKEGAPWAYRYDPRRVWRRLMLTMSASGHRPITMYGMRHSFASNLLIAGVSDVKVSRWLGHGDTRMVHRHYGHLLVYDQDINLVGGRR